jgi:hypothetical protein
LDTVSSTKQKQARPARQRLSMASLMMIANCATKTATKG